MGYSLICEMGCNYTAFVSNITCLSSSPADSCTCDASVFCCPSEACACGGNKTKDTLFTFSWPLVAGWYAMLVILFCFGRRGRFASRFCNLFRRTTGEQARNRDSRGGDHVEMLPVVKTRLLTETDVATEIGAAADDMPVCTICLCVFVVGDVVAALECPHLYHEACILEWLTRKSQCPLCAHRINMEAPIHRHASVATAARTDPTTQALPVATATLVVLPVASGV